MLNKLQSHYCDCNLCKPCDTASFGPAGSCVFCKLGQPASCAAMIMILSILGCLSVQTAYIPLSTLALQKINLRNRLSAFRGDICHVSLSKFTCSVPSLRRNSLMPRFSTTENESTGGYAVLRDMLGSMPVLGGYSSFSELFAKFDKDMSGKISLQELQSTLTEMGAPLSKKQVRVSVI